MFDKKLSPFLVGLMALLLVVVAVAAGWRVVNGDGRLLRQVSVDKSVITPNADGSEDATLVQYQLSRNATVSIYFENEAGERFYFRQEKERGAGDYQVLFSGVVDGYRLPGEMVEGEILSRLLQDGVYTWTVSAVDASGNEESEQGTLTIADADTELPELRNFTLDRHTFTPNQDGIDDRALIQFFLTKEVEHLRVFLLTPEGVEMPIAEMERDVPPRMPGRHYFDYEGGVDQKATPPPDGTYPVFAVAEDREGQKVQVQSHLTIQYGGVPRADIISPPVGDTVQFSATAVTLCDTLQFTLTVRNYGTTPIRTTGPAPGTVYDSTWNYNTLGWETESGAWRVAIGYENELKDYPYRWAVGSVEELERIGDYYYLMPGARAVVTGGIRVVDVFGERNPQPVWAGLIHEDVEIAQFNTRVDPHEILVETADPATQQPCEPREIPVRAP
jgi:hypothetical protein